MEFGLYHLPIYAGGLGMLAGDHMKGASDMSLPMIGVGLYYRYGNFIQRINVENQQEEVYLEADIHSLPMKEWKVEKDETLFVHVDLDNVRIALKVWRVDVGRIRLLLLDANVPENAPEHRSITDHLYVAERDRRLLQEIILGVGGLRALKAIGVDAKVFHLNEGHSAFLIIERLADLLDSEGLSFQEASALIKATTVFTTHTPVEAGNESFSVDLIRKYLKARIESLGVSFDEFIRLGFLHDDQNFWLPAFAIRFSRFINGVSQIHAGVSREMWRSVFPKQDPREIPIIGITNGVHG
jgi:alpha-glucan phosphorylase-like protein